MDEIAYTYDPGKNPDSVVLDGVPLRDLTRAEFEALPKKWQAAVNREPFYVPVKPAKTAVNKEDK